MTCKVLFTKTKNPNNWHKVFTNGSSQTWKMEGGRLPFRTLLVIWVKVFKNGPRKICGRQPLKTLKWYGLPVDHIPLQIF